MTQILGDSHPRITCQCNPPEQPIARWCEWGDGDRIPCLHLRWTCHRKCYFEMRSGQGRGLLAADLRFLRRQQFGLCWWSGLRGMAGNGDGFGADYFFELHFFCWLVECTPHPLELWTRNDFSQDGVLTVKLEGGGAFAACNGIRCWVGWSDVSSDAGEWGHQQALWHPAGLSCELCFFFGNPSCFSNDRWWFLG